METQNTKRKKPIVLRVVFILNAILMFLPFAFYYAIKTEKLDIPGLEPNIILLTAAGYILSFAFIVFCILKRNYLGFKLAFVATFLISLPVQGYIGMFIAILSFALSFHKKIRAYFNKSSL